MKIPLRAALVAAALAAVASIGGCASHHVPAARASASISALAQTRSAAQAKNIFASCEQQHGFTTRADRKALEQCAVPPGHGRAFGRCIVGAALKVLRGGFASRQAEEQAFLKLGEACAVENR